MTFVALRSTWIIAAAAATGLHASPPNTGRLQLSDGEFRLIEAVNAYRAENGLEALTADAKLMRVARRAAPYFDHVVDGQWCWERARRAGFNGWATDNIAEGYETPEGAVRGWAKSHGHARQMRGNFRMNDRWRDYRFNRIGVGISGRKYIAVFGREE
jgi:uncharacterized protein YkwD